jgi:hypothetical protein
MLKLPPTYTLGEISEDVGLVIEEEETWISSIFFIYGKEMLIHGAYTPQACKRLARTLTDVNEYQDIISVHRRDGSMSEIA